MCQIIKLKINHSEDYENYRKSYNVEQGIKIRTIASAIPSTRQLLMANLFDKNKFFLELLELKINDQISVGSATIITDNGRVFILGGSNSK